MKNVEDIYPLTPAQAGMLFHCLKEEQSGQYIIQFSCSIQGDFNSEVFQSVWDKVVQHYLVLRTAFVWENIEEPLQVVRKKVNLNWKIEDLQKNSDKDSNQKIQEYLRAERYKINELAQAPLMRFALFQTGENNRQFCWTCHHLLIDGWSMHMILKNVFEGYEKLVKKEPLNFESSPPFSNYIAWLQSQNQNDAKAYWQKSLANFDTPTPLEVISPKTNDIGSGTFIGQLSKEETSLLKKFAKENRLTLNTLVQGAWALLLSRYNNQKDILFGATVSGRPADLPGVESMAGMCINTLPVRIKIPANIDVITWLTDIQSNLLELKNYEYSSLVDVHGWSEIPRTKTMFDSIVVFENYPLEKTKAKSSIEIFNRQYIEKSNFPLAILVIPDETLQFMIIYDCSQFSKASIADLTERLNSILANFIKYSSKPIEKISVLDDAEEQKIIALGQIKLGSKPDIDFVHRLQEKQALITPQSAAVSYNDESLTYKQLNQRANQLAQYLISLNIEKNESVGIYLERSLEMIIAILAVIKSGAAYLPLDPAYPQKRIDFMIDDAQCSKVITEDHLSDKFANYAGRLILLSKSEEELSKQSSNNPRVTISADQLVYIIYTSGSTGNPKGVMVSHCNLQNSLNARFEYYKAKVENYLLLPSFSFDSSVAGIFWTLCQGGTLVIPDQHKHNDPEYLSELIAANQVTHLLGIPSLYLHLIENYADKLISLKTAIVAGEACSKKVIELHKKEMPSSLLFNEYGPTEATVWSTVFDCLSNYSAISVPVGKAIPGGEIYILDDQLNVLPDNISGEIYLGGKSISKGYLNKPKLTTEKFIANPFDTNNKTMLYKTGDMARRLSDGNIEFVGRNDQQVKLRGYRIETGEIEAVFNNYPGIEEAVVLLKKSSPGPQNNIDTERMAESLLQIDSSEAEKLLQKISKYSDDQAREILSASNRDTANMLSRKIENDDVSINLQLKKDSFIAPPRDAQRQWLISQVVNEFHDDLKHLDAVAKTFVSGNSREVMFDRSNMSDDRIMEDWQIPVMKEMAEKVTHSHGDVLEIGFGRGVSAGFIQDFGVKSHTIIEMDLECISNHFEPWRKKYTDQNIRLIKGRWQDVLEKLDRYDGLFFHAFPMNEKEYIKYVVESITFAEHFFPVAAKLLKEGGVFTYLTTEIDSLSRRHQRALFDHFSEISLSVQPLKIPENTIDAWWADKMVIIKATKK